MSDSLFRTLAGEVAALGHVVAALPRWSAARDTLDRPARRPVPVVLVHGLFGDPTNFARLRRHLEGHGFGRFSSFSYLPRLDYPRLANRLGTHIEAVCRATGAETVDVVGHSLGGLVGRYLAQSGDTRRIRRLVTLGTPYLANTHPREELAIFAAGDPIVPPPADRVRRRMLVIPACGHLALLTDPRALDAVAQWLARPALVAAGVSGLAA